MVTADGRRHVRGGLFLSGFQARVCTMHASFPANFILLGLIVPVMIAEDLQIMKLLIR
jgi:hypothetical protein